MSILRREVEWSKEGTEFNKMFVDNFDFSRGEEGFIGCTYNDVVEGGIKFDIDNLFQGHFEGFTIVVNDVNEFSGLGEEINGGIIRMSKEFARYLVQGLCENRCVTINSHPQYSLIIQLFSENGVEHATYNVVRERYLVTMDIYEGEVGEGDFKEIIARSLDSAGYAPRDVVLVDSEKVITVG